MCSDFSPSSCGKQRRPPSDCGTFETEIIKNIRSIEFKRFLFLFTCADNSFFCNGCDSKFSEEDSLKDHMGQAHSDKPYKCDCCQAAFRYKGNLASHKTVHTGESSIGCRCTARRPPFPLTHSASASFQVQSRTTATSAGLSSTDRPTSRPTQGFTLERSHTSVTPAALDLCR